jgi:hypothetical protein
MKEFIRTLIRENLGKEISRKFLTQYIKGVSDKLTFKLITSWINRGTGDMVSLSPKESTLWNIIKTTGIAPKEFSSKN